MDRLENVCNKNHRTTGVATLAMVKIRLREQASKHY